MDVKAIFGMEDARAAVRAYIALPRHRADICQACHMKPICSRHNRRSVAMVGMTCGWKRVVLVAQVALVISDFVWVCPLTLVTALLDRRTGKFIRTGFDNHLRNAGKLKAV